MVITDLKEGAGENRVTDYTLSSNRTYAMPVSFQATVKTLLRCLVVLYYHQRLENNNE